MAKRNRRKTDSSSDSSDEESTSSSSSYDSSSSSASVSSKKRAYNYKEIKVNNCLFVLYLFLVLFTFMYYFIERGFYMG